MGKGGSLASKSRELKWRVFPVSKFSGLKVAHKSGKFSQRILLAGFSGGLFQRIYLAGFHGQ